MAKLVDLTGATVSVPIGWSASSNYGIFNISGSIEYHDNNYILRSYTFSQFAIGYDLGLDNVKSNYLSIVTGVGTKGFSTVDSSFMITFTDGTDTTNQSLIQWFIDNNATIEGGVWEEERKPILIKNPIILIGSKAKKVVVDNINMTIDVWTKEVPSEEPEIPTDLTGYTVSVPSGWTVTSGYGRFSIIGSANWIGQNIMQGFGVGVDKSWSDSSTNCAITTNFSSPNNTNTYSRSNSDDILLTITGGTDVSNPDLIQWFVNNGATFTKTEGGN